MTLLRDVREALEPFARLANVVGAEFEDEYKANWAQPAVGDLRRAAKAVALLDSLSVAEDGLVERLRDGDVPVTRAQATEAATRIEADALRIAELTAERDARFDLIAHLRRQIAWSERTFGPGTRAAELGRIGARHRLIEQSSTTGALHEPRR